MSYISWFSFRLETSPPSAVFSPHSTLMAVAGIPIAVETAPTNESESASVQGLINSAHRVEG